tara:strand:- start:873 stop:1796 length:924 start_codon:yes stop_codon:yes gene_type:complete
MNIKKPKFWDYKKVNIYACLLYPFSLLIKFIRFFSITRPKRFKLKTICVGNIYVGGTGKTSLSIKIKKILEKKKIKSCFIKKFYNQQTDEQILLKNNGKVFISSNRIEALRQAEQENYDVAILDDGLQDKSIYYDVSLVCFNNINWIGNGLTIPAGPLRENINNLKNYNHIFLNGNLENLDILKKNILKINSKINIHLGKYLPTNLDEFSKEDEYLIFSGIGNHKTFVSMMKNYGFKIGKDLEFPDHYNYTNHDLKKILDFANKFNYKIITTEKDYLRLGSTNTNQIKFIKSELQIIDENNFIRAII